MISKNKIYKIYKKNLVVVNNNFHRLQNNCKNVMISIIDYILMQVNVLLRNIFLDDS